MISNNEFDDWGQQQNADPAQSNPDGNTGVDLMQVAMRRKGLIALGIFLGLCLGVLFYARATEMYETSAQMLIREETTPWTSEDSGLGMGMGIGFSKPDFHAVGLSSPRIVMDTLDKNPALAKLPSLVGQENQAQVILDGLTVAPIQEKSEVLQLVYESTSAEDCGQILDAIMQTYSDFLNNKRDEKGKMSVLALTDRRDDLGVRKDELIEEYEKWKLEESRLTRQANHGINREQLLLAKIEDDIVQEQDRIDRLTVEIDILETAKENSVDPEALLLMAQQSGRTSGLPQKDEAEIRMQQAETQKEARVEESMFQDEEAALRYGKDHPRRKALQRRIDLARKLFQEKISDLGGAEEDEESEKEVDSTAKMLVDYIESLRLSVKESQALLEKLRAHRDEKATLAKSLLADEARQQYFEDAIAEAKAMYAEASTQLNEVERSEQYGSDERFRIERFSDPGIGRKTDPSLAKSLAAGTMLGFLAGFGLGYLVEMFDKTFRSPQEVSELLQLPMIGHIPEIIPEPVENTKLSDTLIAAHKPKSPLAENFRAIRTALYFSTAGQQNHVIQTTSPVPGDGKSTLTANLAITIAQSNKSVLLVDADFRRPTQHKLFGVTNDTGLASVVVGEADPLEAAQATEIPNLHLMACGPRPHNPSELLTSPQFADLIEVLREQYDFVLIDTPPVLAVTDPGIVSARVDGVIMALRIRKNGRPGAMRARKILRDLDANMLGIVVNGIDQRSGAYGYYSNYRRGYGYGNYGGYGKSQESAEQLIGKYFEEPPAELPADENAPLPGNRS